MFNTIIEKLDVIDKMPGGKEELERQREERKEREERDDYTWEGRG